MTLIKNTISSVKAGLQTKLMDTALAGLVSIASCWLLLFLHAVSPPKISHPWDYSYNLNWHAL